MWLIAMLGDYLQPELPQPARFVGGDNLWCNWAMYDAMCVCVRLRLEGAAGNTFYSRPSWKYTFVLCTERLLFLFMSYCKYGCFVGEHIVQSGAQSNWEITYSPANGCNLVWMRKRIVQLLIPSLDKLVETMKTLAGSLCSLNNLLLALS